MKLVDLPIDLLSTITGRIHCLDIENLLLAGDGHLTAKLAAGGVSKLDILVNSKVVPFAWPSCFLLLFKLTHLEFSDTSNASTSTSEVPMTDIFASIADTVKNLRFELPAGSFAAFQSVISDTPFPVLETLSLTISKGMTPINYSPIQWPPSLLSLTLTMHSGYLLDLNLSILPPHLTTLQGTFKEVVPTEGCAFPESLTSLKVKLCQLGSDPIPLLPVGLKTLSISFIISYGLDSATSAIERNAWAKRSIYLLPPSLTSLEWPLKEFKREDVQALPATLQFLHTPNDAIRDLDVLPKLLERWTGSPNDWQALVASDFALLPKRLKELNVCSEAIPHLNPGVDGIRAAVVGEVSELSLDLDALQLKRMSPRIAALQFEEGYGLDVRILPERLTALEIYDGSLSTESLAFLPKTLTTLEVRCEEEDIEAWFKALPEGLISLDLSTALPLPVDSSAALPRTLETLHLKSPKASRLEWFEGLPIGLKMLRVEPVDVPSTSSWRIPLPQNLTRFWISLPFPHLSAEEASKIMQNVIQSLPPLLTSLTIESSAFNRVSVRYTLSDLAFLPKRLQTLSLPTNDAYDDKKLLASILPRSCTSVAIW